MDELHADPDCPPDKAYVLTRERFERAWSQVLLAPPASSVFIVHPKMLPFARITLAYVHGVVTEAEWHERMGLIRAQRRAGAV